MFLILFYIKNFVKSNSYSYYSTFVPPRKTYRDFFKAAAWFRYCLHVLPAAKGSCSSTFSGLKMA